MIELTTIAKISPILSISILISFAIVAILRLCVVPHLSPVASTRVFSISNKILINIAFVSAVQACLGLWLVYNGM